MRVRLTSLLIMLLITIATWLPAAAKSSTSTLTQELPAPLTRFSSMNDVLVLGGVSFELERADFWDEYLVFVASTHNPDGSKCFSRTDFRLQVGNSAYEMVARQSWIRDAYGINSPGTGFFTECVSQNETRLMVLPFAMPTGDGGAIDLWYDDQGHSLSLTLSELNHSAVDAAPTPTPTNTPTRTPTPTPTSTYTPTPTATVAGAILHDSAQNDITVPISPDSLVTFLSGSVADEGAAFTVERMDVWFELPDGSIPDHEYFLVLIGDLAQTGDSSVCVRGQDIELLVGDTRYEMAEKFRAVSGFYDISFPGFFLGQCPGREPEKTFLIFDVAQTAGDVVLFFYNAQLHLSPSLVALRSQETGVPPTPTPLPAIATAALPTALPPTVIAAVESVPVTTLPAADPITLVSWNVESGGALQNVVADRIAAFDGVDIWGLSEVNAIDAEAYEFGAEEGEAANFDSLLGTTGRADRLLLMWDAQRFEQVDSGKMLTIGETGRAPLWVQLREQATGLEFIVMVNHLHRSNDGIRHRQATALNTWAATQTLPVVAMGDWNFDWNLPNGDTDHNLGYDNLTVNGVWEWVRPAELVTTQCSGWPCSYNSVLDFFFVAGPAREWNIASEIIVTEGDFPDDNTTPDHRPVMAVVMPDGAVEVPVATSTSVPTAIPTAIPDPGFSTQEQDYIDFFLSTTESYATALENFGEQFMAAGENPMLLFTDEWKLRAGGSVAAIQMLNKDVREKVAPTRFATTHTEMVNAANYFDQAMALVIEGIDNLDTVKLTAASTSITEGSDAMQRANDQFLIAVAAVIETPTVTSTSMSACPQTNTNSNLRGGPGTDYPVVGSVQQGECVAITGRTEAGDWFQLSNGYWIAAFLVDNVGPMESLPVVAVDTPTPTPTFTPTSVVIVDPPPTHTPTPTSTGGCDPNYTGACIPQVGYDLNCGDIPDRRFQSVGSDPHNFDGDSDGLACES